MYLKTVVLALQLRNLVWSTSKHDVYLMSHYSIVHWSSLSCKKNEVLNVSGHVAPCEVYKSFDVLQYNIPQYSQMLFFLSL
jgi:hypothetical protein